MFAIMHFRIVIVTTSWNALSATSNFSMFRLVCSYNTWMDRCVRLLCIDVFVMHLVFPFIGNRTYDLRFSSAMLYGLY